MKTNHLIIKVSSAALAGLSAFSVASAGLAPVHAADTQEVVEKWVIPSAEQTIKLASNLIPGGDALSDFGIGLFDTFYNNIFHSDDDSEKMDAKEIIEHIDDLSQRMEEQFADVKALEKENGDAIDKVFKNTNLSEFKKLVSEMQSENYTFSSNLYAVRTTVGNCYEDAKQQLIDKSTYDSYTFVLKNLNSEQMQKNLAAMNRYVGGTDVTDDFQNCYRLYIEYWKLVYENQYLPQESAQFKSRVQSFDDFKQLSSVEFVRDKLDLADSVIFEYYLNSVAVAKMEHEINIYNHVHNGDTLLSGAFEARVDQINALMGGEDSRGNKTGIINSYAEYRGFFDDDGCFQYGYLDKQLSAAGAAVTVTYADGSTETVRKAFMRPDDAWAALASVRYWDLTPYDHIDLTFDLAKDWTANDQFGMATTEEIANNRELFYGKSLYINIDGVRQVNLTLALNGNTLDLGKKMIYLQKLPGNLTINGDANRQSRIICQNMWLGHNADSRITGTCTALNGITVDGSGTNARILVATPALRIDNCEMTNAKGPAFFFSGDTEVTAYNSRFVLQNVTSMRTLCFTALYNITFGECSNITFK